MSIGKTLIAFAMVAGGVVQAQAQTTAPTQIHIGPYGEVTVNGRLVSPGRPQARPAVMDVAPSEDDGAAASPRLSYGEWEPRTPDRARDGVREQRNGEPLVIKRDGYTLHFMAKVYVNGVPIRMAVDTGATQSFLSREDAARTGADRKGKGYAMAAGIGGVTPLMRIHIDDIAIGGESIGSAEAMLSGSGGGGMGISLLGQQQIRRMGRIEIEGDYMRIWPRVRTASR
jgi:clan AA aspartic protease (TIGR02281 family)